jgi:hypothetical protein
VNFYVKVNVSLGLGHIMIKLVQVLAMGPCHQMWVMEHHQKLLVVPLMEMKDIKRTHEGKK